jgi:hypothetical protein
VKICSNLCICRTFKHICESKIFLYKMLSFRTSYDKNKEPIRKIRYLSRNSYTHFIFIDFIFINIFEFVLRSFLWALFTRVGFIIIASLIHRSNGNFGWEIKSLSTTHRQTMLFTKTTCLSCEMPKVYRIF